MERPKLIITVLATDDGDVDAAVMFDGAANALLAGRMLGRAMASAAAAVDSFAETLTRLGSSREAEIFRQAVAHEKDERPEESVAIDRSSRL